MPSLFNPKTSAAHRQACLTLFRALLRATHRFPPAISTTLHNLVAYDFKHARNTISLHEINTALTTGREALTTIAHAANGSRTALDELTQKLERRVEHVKKEAAWRYHCAVTLRQPTRKTKIAKVRHLEHHAKKSAHQPKHVTDPDAPPPILKRFEEARLAQTPASNARRRLIANELQLGDLRDAHGQALPILARTPNYIEAQGVPFLRFVGRKSWERHARTSFHARMVRDLARSHERRWEVRSKLEEDMLWGQFEDDWDRILLHVCDVQDDDLGALSEEVGETDNVSSGIGGNDATETPNSIELSNWNNLKSPIPQHVLRSLRSPNAKPLPHLKSWTHDAFVVDYQIAAKIKEQDAVRQDTAKKMWDFVQVQKRMKAERKEERKREWLKNHGQNASPERSPAPKDGHASELAV